MASIAAKDQKSTPETSPSQNSTKSAGRWLELDLLRTVAVALMIMNHTAVRVAADSISPAIDVAGLVGSMAPVVFFFLTGLGNGVQSTRGNTRLRPDFFIKIAILFVADAFLWVRPDRWIGMDFLGFIALSALATKLLTKLPRSGVAAAALAGGLVAWRYFVHPKIHGSGSSLEPWVDWICIGAPGFSYPFAPWLAYPLIGYCLGRAAANRRGGYEAARTALAFGFILAAVAATGASAFLTYRGAPFFRWGAVSFSFFIASLSALGFALAAVMLASRARWGARLTTGSQQSVAAVPLHYATLGVLDGTLGKAWGAGAYFVRLAAAMGVSFAGGGLVARASQRLAGAGDRTAAAWWGVGAATAASLACLAFLTPPWWATIVLRYGPQLGLCLLLGLPLPSRARPAADGSAAGTS